MITKAKYQIYYFKEDIELNFKEKDKVAFGAHEHIYGTEMYIPLSGLIQGAQRLYPCVVNL